MIISENSESHHEHLKYFILDLDECLLDTHNCHKDATCTNTYGLWNCTCNTAWKGEGTGFEGNGTHCYGKDLIIIAG